MPVPLAPTRGVDRKSVRRRNGLPSGNFSRPPVWPLPMLSQSSSRPWQVAMPKSAESIDSSLTSSLIDAYHTVVPD